MRYCTAITPCGGAVCIHTYIFIYNFESYVIKSVILESMCLCLFNHIDPDLQRCTLKPFYLSNFRVRHRSHFLLLLLIKV